MTAYRAGQPSICVRGGKVYMVESDWQQHWPGMHHGEARPVPTSDRAPRPAAGIEMVEVGREAAVEAAIRFLKVRGLSLARADEA